MDNTYFDTVFEKQDYTESDLPKGDYENCSFINCIFSGSSLADINFSDCTFTDCDLSMVNVNNTAFRTHIFKGCKMLGVQFGNSNSFVFTVEFRQCNMNHASFFRLKAKQTTFEKCSLVEVDFTEADMSGSNFSHCDLSGAIFQESNLEKVDFRTAVHYAIDPARNRIKKAMFTLAGLPGLLDQYDIVIEH